MSTNQKKQDVSLRQPVVVIMGHVDHGKSTLLDFIRKTNVVEKEAGGITQHLSAYEVSVKQEGKDHLMTFLDTPGHAAFSGIRHRGANVADIAILVVSAEDGAKTQTIEAWQSIVSAGISPIVAINKIDKPEANPERTKQTLAENGIYVEGYGGDIPAVLISAKTGAGTKELLETIALVAEMADLKFDQAKTAEGFVIEAHKDARRGISATIIIKDGLLQKGDFVISGQAISATRILEDTFGQPKTTFLAGQAAQILGWDNLPTAGEIFSTTKDKKSAEIRREAFENKLQKDPIIKTDENTVIVPIVLRTDTLGSLEAVSREIEKVSDKNVFFKIIDGSIGAVTENDLKRFAENDKGIILAFHTTIPKNLLLISKEKSILIGDFNIIYKLSEWLEEEKEKRRKKTIVEKTEAKAKLLRIFSETKGRHIVGGKVLEGELSLGASCKIIRRNQELGRGKIVGLQEQKKEVKEVSAGRECGLLIEIKLDLAEGDLVETFSLKEE